jgi:hypothetical protein
MKPRFSMFIGVGLIAIALIGFLSVADDLHHSGEFFAVTGILFSGVALYVSGRFPHIAAHLSLAWVPAGIGAGIGILNLRSNVQAFIDTGAQITAGSDATDNVIVKEHMRAHQMDVRSWEVAARKKAPVREAKAKRAA